MNEKVSQEAPFYGTCEGCPRGHGPVTQHETAPQGMRCSQLARCLAAKRGATPPTPSRTALGVEP